jgi:TM2 domain-containing membrane protein YozV
MSSGIIIAAILEKDNAVADFRTLIGATIRKPALMILSKIAPAWLFFIASGLIIVKVLLLIDSYFLRREDKRNV